MWRTCFVGQLLVVAAVSSSLLACGSSEGDGDGAGANGSGGTKGGPVLIGGSTGTGAGKGTHDGGLVPLTADEVDDITNAACTGWSAEGENLPAVLQLVVDVSGSMDDPAPGGNRRSKWQVTRDALSDAIDTLPASVSAGVLYYPNRDTGSSTTARPVNACVNVDEMVPIAILGNNGSAQRGALQSSLDDANTDSYTPTHDAYHHALKSSLEPFQAQANKFMLLITDGAPTMSLGCIGGSMGGMMGGGGGVVDAPTQPIVDEIKAAFGTGIRTFLIGSPGSEMSSEGNMDMRPWMSKAAQEGGTAQAGCQVDGPNFCHLDMTQEPDFGQALVEGLATVVGQIIDTCTFAVPPAPDGQTVDPNLTTLIIESSMGATLALQDDKGDCGEGWRFNASGQVELCPATCEKIKGDASARVQLMFGCTVDQVVPVK
jgi:hypothetical protein